MERRARTTLRLGGVGDESSIRSLRRTVNPMTVPIFIYVIGRPKGPVKVGVSNSPSSRMLGLQTGCPFKLELLLSQPMRNRAHALRHEADFHAVYEEKRLIGEWFKIDAELAIELIEVGLEHEAYFESESQT